MKSLILESVGDYRLQGSVEPRPEVKCSPILRQLHGLLLDELDYVGWERPILLVRLQILFVDHIFVLLESLNVDHFGARHSEHCEKESNIVRDGAPLEHLGQRYSYSILET